MTSTLPALLQERVSTNVYDQQRTLDQAMILELIQQAISAPSAFNMQNWSFLVVHSEEAKQRLLPISYGQQKVVQAAATVIICGVLNGYETLAQRFESVVAQDQAQAQPVQKWAAGAQNTYANNPQGQRDEAIRSASLAGMTFMLAAQAKGLATGPMIGFDAAALQQAFQLDANEIPAIMITVGYAAAGNSQQKPRIPATNITRFV